MPIQKHSNAFTTVAIICKSVKQGTKKKKQRSLNRMLKRIDGDHIYTV